MKNLLKIGFSLFIMAAVLTGCSSNKPLMGQSKSKDILGQLMKKKQEMIKDGLLAEVVVSHSSDLQTGIDKAELDSRAKIARALESKIASLQKQFKEEVGEEFLNHFSQVTKNITSRTINGTTLWETPYEKTDEGEYRVYALMVLDSKVYAQALNQELAGAEAMKQRWMASKAYDELNQEVQAFEKWKNENSPVQN